MINKVSQHFNKGMNRDLSDSKVSNEFAYENYNIRITENDGDTLLSITNERGNKQALIYNEDNSNELFDIKGDYCGHAIVNEYLVLFTRYSNINYIYRIKFTDDKVLCKTLVDFDLEIYPENPVECICDYQTENIIKVYWVDGINQTRVINILDNDHIGKYTKYDFDFAIHLDDVYSIFVESDYQKYGEFPSGVIQYFVTGVRLNRESSILCQSELLYLKDKNRGLSPNENYYFQNKIEFTANANIFEYYILYSIERTSLDTEPIARKIKEFNKEDLNKREIIIYDDGIHGESISASDLLYKGSDVISPETIATKDNVLFLGNINLKSTIMSDELIEAINNKNNYEFNYGSYRVNISNSRGVIEPYLRGDNYYRFGIQFKDKYGKWSSVFHIKDYKAQRSVQINGDYADIPITWITINQTLANKLLAEDFLEMRILIVFPNEGERTVIAQGILNQNVINIGDRNAGNGYTDSSWFWRPITEMEYIYGHDTSGSNNGRPAPPTSEAGQAGQTGQSGSTDSNTASFKDTKQECRPYYPLKFASSLGAEIQSQHEADMMAAWEDNSKTLSQYLIDPEVQDFYSPDIENYYKDTISKDQLECSVVGVCGDPILNKDTIYQYNSRVSTETPKGILSMTAMYYPNRNKYNVSTNFFDSFYDDPENPTKKITKEFIDGTQNAGLNYAIYPWHRDSSLNNDIARDNRTAVLKRKIFSKFYKFNTYTLNNPINFNIKSDLYKFDNTLDFLKIEFDGKQYLYRGNVNTIVTNRKYATPIYIAKYEKTQSIFSGEYVRDNPLYGGANSIFNKVIQDPVRLNSQVITSGPAEDAPEELITLNSYYLGQLTNTTYVDTLIPNGTNALNYDQVWIKDRSKEIRQPTTNFAATADPISIKYKTVNHGVIALEKPLYKESSLNIQQHFLWFADKADRPDYTTRYDNSVSVDCTAIPTNHDYVLYLVNIKNKNINEDTIFGGKNEYALKNNLWIPASHPEIIKENREIRITAGDTFLHRYDVLKTFPYTNEDKNSVIEIGSFFVESYRNLLGRYDKNYDLDDYTIVNENNFGLYNDVYNQKNNFLNYRYLPEDLLKTNEYKNQFIWTLEHTSGADIDSWTNITYGSYYNVDGNNGEIRAIRKFRDTLIGFQDSGIFEILFNSRSQLSTTNGMPIELGNSGKVDGVRYFTNKQGCINKWSIIETPYGLYFIDDLNYSINRLNGQSFDNLTDNLGFAQWAKDNIIPYKKWNINNNGFRSYYDRILNDVYFTFNDKSLVYSEKLNQFMSFIDYPSSYVLDNINDKFLSFNNKLWYNREGNYNSFFGNKKDYYITYRIAPDPYLNKLFNNIEYITTVNSSTSNYTDLFIQGVNQYGESDLTKRDKLPPFNLQKKFNVWRANIPREKGKALNRIQSPWIYLTLKSDKNKRQTEEKIELHDLLVKYSVI